eukprot:11241608-Alexandrium_andersonii.AAC.1
MQAPRCDSAEQLSQPSLLGEAATSVCLWWPPKGKRTPIVSGVRPVKGPNPETIARLNCRPRFRIWS